MSMPRGQHRTSTTDDGEPSPVLASVEPGLEVDPADLAEQQTDALLTDAGDDPEQQMPVRPPALDHASEVDAADSLVEIRLDDEEDWEA